VLNKAALLL